MKYCEIEINGSECIAQYIKEYAATLIKKQIFSLTGCEINYITNEYEFILELPLNQTNTIIFEDNEIEIQNKEREGIFGGAYEPKIYSSIILRTNEGKDILLKFINAAYIYSKKEIKDTITCYTNDMHCWSKLNQLHKRDKDTVYFGDNKYFIKLLDDVNKFLKSEEKYKKYGIPYKRNYCLSGPPGVGKTTCVYTIASELDMDIAILNCSNETSDFKLMKVISKLPKNTILLFEDIDCLFKERESNTTSGISFSTILNILDGIARKNKMITFLTTNFEKTIDKALLRPGRIDYHIRLEFAIDSQIEEMFLKFFPNEDVKKFMELLDGHNITLCALEGYLFEKLDNQKNLYKEIKKLYELCKLNENNNNLYL